MRSVCRTSPSTCARRSAAAVVTPFVDGYAAGLTPNPCMRCNGAFRFDALSTSPSAPGRPSSGRGTTPGSSSATVSGSIARAPTRQGPVVHARDRRPGAARRVAFPLGGQGQAARDRGGARPASPWRAARRARRPASSRAATTAAFSSARGVASVRATIVDERGTISAATKVSGGSHPASAAGSARARGADSRSARRARDQHARRRAARARFGRATLRRGEGCTCRSRRRRPSFATARLPSRVA